MPRDVGRSCELVDTPMSVCDYVDEPCVLEGRGE